MGCGGSKPSPSAASEGEAIRMRTQSRTAPTRQRTSHTSHQRTRTHTSATTREREGGRASSSRPRTQRQSRHGGGSTTQRRQSRAHNRPHGPSTIHEEHVSQPEDSAIEEQIDNLNYLVDQHTQTFYRSNLPFVRSQIGYKIITGPVQNEVDGEPARLSLLSFYAYSFARA
jgi:hypothetical protein